MGDIDDSKSSPHRQQIPTEDVAGRSTFYPALQEQARQKDADSANWTDA
jgi:hypothetical protein